MLPVNGCRSRRASHYLVPIPNSLIHRDANRPVSASNKPEKRSAENADEPISEASHGDVNDSAPPDDAAAETVPPANGDAGQPNEDELPDWEPLTPELVEDEALRGDFMLRLVIVLVAFLLACTQISESETLVHVKSGQYMSAHGFLPPEHDVFSYTAEDRRWINLAWLFDNMLAGVFAVGGAVGLSLLKAFIAAIAFGIVVHIGKPGVSTWWSSICAALAILVCYPQFTARPEIVTLLGVAVTLRQLSRWHEGGSAGKLWALIPVFLIWANLDPRVFLGVALLALFALGHTLGSVFGLAERSSAPASGQLWAAVAGCIVVSLINPFGVNSLTAPLTMYGLEYPTFRRIYSVSVDDLFRPPASVLHYYPMYSAVFWKWLGHGVIAGLLLMMTAAVSLVLNRQNMRLSHVMVFLGFAMFAVAGSHELAAASLVFCVLATLNAQEWYRGSFRQTYSIETSELLFSRGGRAATVLALFALAYLAISGWIGGGAAWRTGVGLHASLAVQVDGLKEELSDSFDNRPFNPSEEQGDFLIWADQKVFVDTRVALYAGGDTNLLDLHDKTRRALRRDRPGHVGSGQPDIWKSTLDRYGVTHVLPRLSGDRPDFTTYADLTVSEDWQLTQLGAVSASFYRTDLSDPELKSYLAAHQVQFTKTAFRQDEAEPPIRADWAQPRSAYQKILSLPETTSPNSVQSAQHLFTYLGSARQFSLPLTPERAVAIIHLAIRKANQGLADDPQLATAYRILGGLYELLDTFETRIARRFAGTSPQKRRYFQAVQAYNQALLISPNHAATRQMLMSVYLRQLKRDLALRELKLFNSQLATASNSTSPEAVRRRMYYQEIEQRLTDEVEQISQRANSLFNNGADPLTVGQFAYQHGCILKALDVIENAPSIVHQNLEVQRFKAVLLLESGQCEEASNQLEQMEAVAQRDRFTRWRSPAALASLGNANYARAISIWNKEADELETRIKVSLLQSLPLAAIPRTWPLGQTSAAISALHQFPSQAADDLFNVALSELETGNNSRAVEVFHRVLEFKPDSPMRPLIHFYLLQLTDEEIDPVAPSDQIPTTADMFTEDSDDAPETATE